MVKQGTPRGRSNRSAPSFVQNLRDNDSGVPTAASGETMEEMRTDEDYESEDDLDGTENVPALPIEIWFMVSASASANTILSLSCCCRAFREAFRDPAVQRFRLKMGNRRCDSEALHYIASQLLCMNARRRFLRDPHIGLDPDDLEDTVSITGRRCRP